jgi:arginyl-tRNA--protein-N-Asp/Glu arginylyltransferase
MESVFRFIAPPGPCGYLPGQTWQLEYEVVSALTPAEYYQRLVHGWRRFGHVLFRPRCPSCAACRSLRVEVARFRPHRSQRRNQALNQGDIQLRIGEPSVTPAKLDLYDRYHAFQSGNKGWPDRTPKDAADYRESFVLNPFPTEEWRYSLGRRLVGVGYVDVLPEGLSAIYFYYDPDERDRGLGTWNVLNVIDQAAQRDLPYVYLGYYVDGCDSLAYKGNYSPNQTLTPEGDWHAFRE